MADYGLNDEGYLPKTQQIIAGEMDEEIRDAFSVNARGILAKLRDQVATIAAEIYEVGGDIVSGMDPDQANGVMQNAICALTGTFRDPPKKSTVVLTLGGVNASPVPTGTQATAVTTRAVFETLEDVVIATVSAWTISTLYAVGDRRTNGGNVYDCITAGTSAGSGGPTTTAADITDGTAHWRYVFAGTAAVDVLAAATLTGPLTAVAGDITERTTPQTGWNVVTNLLDAEPGALQESNEGLRERREDELAKAGKGTLPAIRAAVLGMLDSLGNKPAKSVTVFRNNTDTTDGDGLPPHSVEVLVRMIDNAENKALMAKTLFENVSGPAYTHGTTTVTYEDSQGTDHEYKYTYPTEIPIYIEIDLYVDEETWPADGEDQVKAAIVAWGDDQDTGRDARSERVAALAMIDDSVLYYADCFIGTSASPVTSTPIAIALRELATYDTSRIVVNVNFATP